MESRRTQREAYLRRRRERRRRLMLRWFVLLGCLVVVVFLALILTDSCEGSARSEVAPGSPGLVAGLSWPVDWEVAL